MLPLRSPVAKRLIPDLRISEAHAETENLLLLRVNLPGLQIDAQWHADPSDVHRCVEAALGEDVNQHRQGGRVLEEQIFGVDAGDARDRVANHDGHHLAFNESFQVPTIVAEVGPEATKRFFEFFTVPIRNKPSQ
jgi:hypothetical protein